LQRFDALADMLDMTAPRQIIPGQSFMITRRTSERRFFLRPDKTVNHIVEFCIALAAQNFGISLHALSVLTNHYHLEGSDPDGNLPYFLRDLHRMIAQCLNQYWKRDEALWSSDKTSVVTLLDPDSQLEKLFYVTLNPVNAGLVPDYRQWPGVLYTARDWLRSAKTIKRPDYFFVQDSSVPQEVSLRFVPPPALADRDIEQLSKEIEQTLGEKQRAIQAEFEASGRRFMGVKRILKVNPFDRPETSEPKNKLNPCLSASDPEVMKRGKKRLRYFRQLYREALSKLRAGLEAIFPYGTFWYQRFLNVPCEPAYTMMI
jgi:putative transposase